MIDIMLFMEEMGQSSIPLVAAFFIGLMMSMSPCPLATNITALAYSSKEISDKKKTILSASFYTAGRVLTYMVITSSIVYMGMNLQNTAFGLQKYGSIILGPVLIVFAMVLLEILKFDIKSAGLDKINEKLVGKGYVGNFLMGVIFSLAFCPFSAVLFFGMMVPLALRFSDGVLIPTVFAFATGLPVIFFSFVLAYSTSKLNETFDIAKRIEKWMRKLVAALLFILGIYYTFEALM